LKSVILDDNAPTLWEVVAPLFQISLSFAYNPISLNNTLRLEYLMLNVLIRCYNTLLWILEVESLDLVGIAYTIPTPTEDYNFAFQSQNRATAKVLFHLSNCVS